MQKTILLTGATDGIGLETARMLVSMGHHVLVHGRNRAKLDDVQKALSGLPGGGRVESHACDLSRLRDVEPFARSVAERHERLDVLINNAGILKSRAPVTADGLDVRFAVNTIAPYILTRRLLPLLGPRGRVVNLSSAAQAPVDTDALAGRNRLSDDLDAYGQSKLAITMWSTHMALAMKEGGPLVVSVNPGSLLGSKMVKEGFGVAGGDLGIGADILVRAALSDEFRTASGKYFDNDAGRFAPPHADALDPRKSAEIVGVIDEVVAGLVGE